MTTSIKGKTAVVTGASSGIGAAIARGLAAEGVNWVLVARSEAKWVALADQLRAEHGVRTMLLARDLSLRGCGAQLQQQLQAQGVAVDILVNNAGFGTYGPFDAIAAETEQEEIAVNVAAVVDMAHAFLPAMLARGAGAIVNVASTASFQPVPYMAVYAASKAFVLSFSEALWAEYRGQGIQVVAVCPGAVDTAFVDRLGDESVRHTAVFAVLLAPERVAARAVHALRGGAPTHIVGFKNWLMAQSVRFAPRNFVARMGAKVMRPTRQRPGR